MTATGDATSSQDRFQNQFQNQFSGQGGNNFAALRIWCMLLGGGVAWFVQFLVLYVLAEFGGVAGGEAWVAWSILAVTLVAVASAGWCWWLARRYAMQDTPSYPSELIEPRFLSRSAMLGNAIFAFIIVAQAVPVFFFWNC